MYIGPPPPVALLDIRLSRVLPVATLLPNLYYTRVHAHAGCHYLLESTQNPENLLIFAAGNFGEPGDGRDVCTITSPAIAKNVLAVGSTSSGTTRVTTTGTDGEQFDGFDDRANIDTVSYFSSYGPTQDNRIKPEVVAPGDLVRTCGIQHN